MPKTAMRLYNMCKTALLAKDAAARVSGHSDDNLACYVCQDEISAHDPPTAAASSAGTDAAVILRCPSCTLTAHAECSRRIAAYADEHGLDLQPFGMDLARIDFDLFDKEPFSCGMSTFRACTLAFDGCTAVVSIGF